MTTAELATFLKDITAAELVQRREAVGLTQAQLAIVLGVSEPTISRWERGGIKVPKAADAALRLLEAAREKKGADGVTQLG